MKKMVVLFVCTLGFLNADFKKVDTYNNKYCFDFKEKLRKCNSLPTNYQRQMCRLNLFAVCK